MIDSTTPSSAEVGAEINLDKSLSDPLANFEDTPKIAETWHREIKLYEKKFDRWLKRARRLIKRYRDERGDGRNMTYRDRKLNIFWSNVEVLKPALYARTPKPQIERRWKDNDPVSRVAVEILERVTTLSVQGYAFDNIVRQVRDDYLRVGRGTLWVEYKPYFESVPMNGEMVEQVVSEEAICSFVGWPDFGHSDARTWEEVRAVWRKVFLTRQELIERFGQEKGEKVDLDFKPDVIYEDREMTLNEQQEFKKAIVYEIWDKKTKKVIWISKGFNDVLDLKDDLLGLHEFFPCPRPLYATLTTDSLIPIPDFAMYQDQAEELDDVTNRISLLTDALKVAGVYDASCEELQRLMNEGSENQLIPVQNWPQFLQQGGFQGVVQFLPITETANALLNLYQIRDRLKNDIYEITGMSDIIRGVSYPNETATAQQLKGQFATLRISEKQQEVQRFVRDTIGLLAEIIAIHFSPQTLALASDMQLISPEASQQFEAAVQLLKNDLMRSFRIDIETDSIMAIDENAEKQNRTEFLQAFGQFLQLSAQATQIFPGFLPIMGEILLFGVRGFRAGRNLESTIETAFENMEQQANQAQEQSSQPEMDAQAQAQMMKSQNDKAIADQKLSLMAQKLAQDQQLKAYEIQNKRDMSEKELQAKIQLEIQKMIQNAQIKMAENGQKAQAAYQSSLLKGGLL